MFAILQARISMRNISLLFIFLVIISSNTFIGCANIIAPSGGPRDSLPPVLVAANPKDSATQFKFNKIVLTFNEFVELQNIQDNVIVSPTPVNNPQIDYKLRTITIKLKDSLETNTTYSIDFGKAIKDINEGNVLPGFKYVFSTGKSIDSNKISGKVLIAETGLADSTLIAVLHSNLSDSAITKLRPRYFTKLTREGQFEFTNLPNENFSLFVVPNDYSKKYDDNSKLFAFLNESVKASGNTKIGIMYAFVEEKKLPQSTNTSNAVLDKTLKYSNSLDLARQDINTNLQLKFNHKIKSYDSLSIQLFNKDSSLEKNYFIQLDSSKKILTIHHNWRKGEKYSLILNKNAIIDTSNKSLAKNDTLLFKVKTEEDYGNVFLKFNNLDTTLNPVLLLLQGERIIESSKLTSKNWNKKLFKPGDYEIKILFDKNNNGIWDTGHFLKNKVQPEIIKDLNIKLNVRANWDNEKEINL